MISYNPSLFELTEEEDDGQGKGFEPREEGRGEEVLFVGHSNPTVPKQNKNKICFD